MRTSTLSPHSSAPLLVVDFPKHASEREDIALIYTIATRFAVVASADIPNEVVEVASREVPCDSCSIYLLEGEEFILCASKSPHSGTVDRLPKRKVTMLAPSALEQARPIVIAKDAHKDPRFTAFNRPSEPGFESFMSVPIATDARLIGFINIQRRAAGNYTDREIGLVATLGLMMASEIERKRLKTENAILLGKLETRRLVERAKGMLQRDLNISEEASYRVLQRESQERRRSMRDIAEAVILSDSLKTSRCAGAPAGRDSRSVESPR